MSHKKSGGKTRTGRDSNPKYLGVMRGAGQPVTAGTIIVRQRGTRYLAGENVGVGNDYTIYSLVDGMVRFSHRRKNHTQRVVVNVDGLA